MLILILCISPLLTDHFSVLWCLRRSKLFGLSLSVVCWKARDNPRRVFSCKGRLPSLTLPWNLFQVVWLQIVDLLCLHSFPSVERCCFCWLLAEHAVHAGMAGKTDMLVGFWNNFFTHVPIELATLERRMIDLDGALWKGVLSSTQQHPSWKSAWIHA